MWLLAGLDRDHAERVDGLAGLLPVLRTNLSLVVLFRGDIGYINICDINYWLGENLSDWLRSLRHKRVSRNVINSVLSWSQPLDFIWNQ